MTIGLDYKKHLYKEKAPFKTHPQRRERKSEEEKKKLTILSSLQIGGFATK
jgi:hypothetical protein